MQLSQRHLKHIIHKTILTEMKISVHSKSLSETNKVPAEDILVEYKKLEAQIEQEKKAIADTLQRIKSKETNLKKLYDLIELLMQEQGKTEISVEDAVARLEDLPKFKIIRADFKDLWEQALSKVNAATRAVLEQMMEVHLDLKRKERKTELVIKEGAGDVQALGQHVSEWVNAYKEYKASVSELLKTIK